MAPHLVAISVDFADLERRGLAHYARCLEVQALTETLLALPLPASAFPAGGRERIAQYGEAAKADSEAVAEFLSRIRGELRGVLETLTPAGSVM